MLSKIQAFLFEGISPTTVSIFRIVFGSFMVYQVLYYYSIDFTYEFMTGPEVLFPYSGLEAMTPLPLKMLKIMHLGLLVSAILMTIGYLFKYASIYFTLVFTYFSFIDNTLYNNHIYLISLISFVFIFTQADAQFAFKGRPKAKIPAWNQYLFIFLISLPYFYGGIAKLSPTWFSSNLVYTLVSSVNTSADTRILPLEWLINFVTYGGVLYDLLIVFILLNQKTFKWGVLLVILFNTSNHFLLFNDIGLFPFLMIFSTIIFVPSNKLQEWIKKYVSKWSNQKTIPKTSGIQVQVSNKPVQTFAIIGFVFFHLIFPFRHFLIDGNPEWTGEGNKFAWRMKMQSRKLIRTKMAVFVYETKEINEVNPLSFITQNQAKHLTDSPLNLVTLAKHVQQEAVKKYRISPPMVKMDLIISFNGGPEQPFSPRI